MLPGVLQDLYGARTLLPIGSSEDRTARVFEMTTRIRDKRGLLSWALATTLVATARPAEAQAAATPDSSRLAVVSLTSAVFGNTRSIRAYLPPGYDDAANASRRYPVLYFNDGFAV